MKGKIFIVSFSKITLRQSFNRRYVRWWDVLTSHLRFNPRSEVSDLRVDSWSVGDVAAWESRTQETFESVVAEQGSAAVDVAHAASCSEDSSAHHRLGYSSEVGSKKIAVVAIDDGNDERLLEIVAGVPSNHVTALRIECCNRERCQSNSKDSQGIFAHQFSC